MGQTSSHQITTFSVPVNATSPIDANTVRGNDNSIKTSYNAHDSDTTIHVQNGAVASRPAASVAGQSWLATDTGAVYLYLDTGSAWVEANYLRNTGGTVSGAVTMQALTATTGTFSGLIVANAGISSTTGAFTGAVSGITSLGAQTGTFSGLVVFNGGVSSTTGVFTGAVSGITTLSLAGPITLTNAASQVIPGATSYSLRNNANSADNWIVTDAGNGTLRGNLVVSGSSGGDFTVGGIKTESQIAASFGAGSAGNNGYLLLDSTNNRFVYYVGGSRFFLTGTSF